MEQQNVDAAELNEMLKLMEKYKAYAELRKQVQEAKAESQQRINLIIAAGDGHTRQDFKLLTDTLSLCENAYGAIGNMVVIQYYLREIDPDGMLLPEEIKDVQYEIEMHLEGIREKIANWFDEFVEGVAEENKAETPGGETPGGERGGRMRVLPSFAIFKLKLRGEKDAFAKLLQKKLEGIKQRLTKPDMEEVKEEFADLIKKMSAGVA